MSTTGRTGAPPNAVATEVTILARRLVDASTVHDVLVRIAAAAETVVPGAELVSITLHRPGGPPETPVATAPLAATLDELQFELAEGPGIEVDRTAGLGIAGSSDLQADRAFGAWGRRATELGIRSVLGIGLFPRRETARRGALNLYACRAGAFDGAVRDLAVVLAAHAATALAGTIATTAAELRIARLREALHSRDIIGQAKGILMERRGIGEAEASEILHAASRSGNVELARVAARVAERSSGI